MKVPVIYVERGCPAAPMGCGCTGQCHERIAVVRVEDVIALLADVARNEQRPAEESGGALIMEDVGR